MYTEKGLILLKLEIDTFTQTVLSESLKQQRLKFQVSKFVKPMHLSLFLTHFTVTGIKLARTIKHDWIV
jgi:hypothetical protein